MATLYGVLQHTKDIHVEEGDECIPHATFAINTLVSARKQLLT